METLEQLSAGYRDRAQRAAQALGRLQRLIYRIGGSIFIALALKVLWDVYVSFSAA